LNCPNLTCNNGYKVDSRGCKICECKECPLLTCPAIYCPNGVKYENGCPTCQCRPCQNFCPDGYTNTNGAPSTVDCKCHCKELVCQTNCTNNAYVYNQYGCKTCECKPDISVCPKIACNLFCEHGYKVDDKNCPTCECVVKPPVCPLVLCAFNCVYGFVVDRFGCQTCDCKPCPEVMCARFCPFGFKKGNNGCPYCDCNPAPVCPTTSNTGVVNSVAECPLNCEKGLVTDSGCTYCKCNPVEPCTCGPVPTDKPLICPDNVNYQKYTNVCARDPATNKCYYILTRCPIGISLTVAKELTEADFDAIKAKIGVTNSADVTYTKTTNANGSVTYTIWVDKESLPKDRSATDVNNDVDESAKNIDSGAHSYVLSDGTPNTDFANIVAPILGLIALVLFF